MPYEMEVDSDPVVDLDAPEDGVSEAPLVFEEDDPNLVAVFMEHKDGRKALKRLSQQVIEDFDAAWEGAEEYRERASADWKLFAGDLPKKTWPFEHCANAHVPMMLENITRLTFRAQAELFGDWQNVCVFTPIGPDDEHTAQILSRHSNWQINTQIRDFKRQQARGLLIYFAGGDVTSHSYYDNEREQNAHEILTCDDFVTPFSHVTTMPDYSDLPYYCKIKRLYRHQIEAMRGKWHDVDAVLESEAPSWEDAPESAMRRAVAEVQGTEAIETKRSTAYKLIHYEGWAELPGHDRQRFVKMVVDYATHSVLELTIHEEVDWQDQQRYERELAEMQMYIAARDEHAAMTQSRELAEQTAAQQSTSPEHYAFLTSAIPPLPPEPMPPGWVQSPEDLEAGPLPPKRKPLYMFGHAVCIEPIVGNLGLSYGRMQADHNRAADTWLSQFTDSATLGNAWGLIVAQGIEFERPFSFGPGKINEAKNVAAGELDKYIKELKPGQANPQLTELIDRVWTWAQSSMQAPSVLSGEAGKSGETFRGISSRIEQATKQLTVTTRAYADFLKNILQNNAKLNATFMKDEEIVQVNNELIGTMEELRVGRALYLRNYQIQIRADLRYASDAQRVAEADEVAGMTNAFPDFAANPRLRYLAIKKALEARGRHDMVQALGDPPPSTPFGAPPPPPPGMGQPGAPPGAPPNAPPPPPGAT